MYTTLNGFSNPRPRPNLRLVRLAVAAVLAAALLAAGGANAATISSNGFDSMIDGYSFANYGDEVDARNLTPGDLRKFFGPRICSTIDDGRCILSPEGESWMEAMNSGMAGGHCFGMAATAQFFYMGVGKPSKPDPFGAPSTFELAFDGNRKLQSHIAYGWAMQALPSVQSATRKQTPRQIVKRLVELLAAGDARHVLTILDDGAGHGITPIAIEDDGDGKRRIAVYDNNWPGETRYVEVDMKANTWSYQLFEGADWGGDAKTKTLGLMDVSRGLGRQSCFICAPKKAKPGQNVGKTMRLMWQGDAQRGQHGSLVVRDGKGRRSGCGPSGCVNRIPGVRMHEMLIGAVRPWRLTPPPVFELPTRKAYEVTLGATGLKGRASESVSLIGRGFSFSASGIRLHKGERDTIRVARKGRRVLFLSGSKREEKPTIEITSSNVAGGADYKIEIKPAGVDRGAGIAASFAPDERVLRLENRRGDPVEHLRVLVTEYGRRQQQFTLDVKVRRGKTKKIPLS